MDLSKDTEEEEREGGEEKSLIDEVAVEQKVHQEKEAVGEGHQDIPVHPTWIALNLENILDVELLSSGTRLSGTTQV